MKDETLMPARETQTTPTYRAEVILVHQNDSVTVACDDSEVALFTCVVLQTSEGRRLRLAPGDMVLAVRDRNELGMILGRIGPSHAQSSEVVPETKDKVPDELVIEAKKNLTLKCGDGSITIRADGKILIKGKDLISHAQRTNRIKGGSVAIN